MGRHLTVEDRNYWVIDWLSRQGPAEWHGLATAWDWEDGVEPLHWIIEQDDCDRATALAIFWESDPEYFLSEDGIETPIGEMDEDIAARWKAGQYKTNRFSFDPEDKADLPEESHVNDVITIDMGMAVSGSERAPSYSYGLPEEIDAAWNKANGVVERPVWSPEDEDDDDTVGSDWSVGAAPDFSVPDFAASASAAINGATYENGAPVSNYYAAEQASRDDVEQSDVVEEPFEEQALEEASPVEISPEEPEVFTAQTPEEAFHAEPLYDAALVEAEEMAHDDGLAAIPAEPDFAAAPSTSVLPSILFSDDHEDDHDVAPPPSLAAYSWKSKPMTIAPVEIEAVVEAPVDYAAEAEEPAQAWQDAVAPQEAVVEEAAVEAAAVEEAVVEPVAEEAFEPLEIEASQEEEAEAEPLSYEDVSFAAIDYSTSDYDVPAQPFSDSHGHEAPAYQPEPQAEQVFAAHSPVFDDYPSDDLKADEFVADEAPHDPYTVNAAHDGLMVEDVVVEAAPYTAPEQVADDTTFDDMAFEEEPIEAAVTLGQSSDDEEDDEEGEDASFAYDLRSMFAPPPTTTPVSKFGTAVRVPNPDPEPYVPTEAELAARAAAVEAEAQVSSRIRSLRHEAIEEAQQAQQSASSGLMGKMRSMLGR